MPRTEPHTPPFVRTAGSLLLYLLIALWILWPYRLTPMRRSGDFGNVIAGIVEAANAMEERQFPIRVAPNLNSGLRYPLFQYYGNFPYSVTGAIRAVFGADPYTAWKIVTLASLVLGAHFVRRLAYVLSHNHTAALVAGAVFLCSPYLMTDINARGAFAEMIAFELLPAAFYFTLQCVLSARWRYVILAGLTWTLIGLTHNITYVYGLMFCALFTLPFLIPPRRKPRILRLLAAGAVHFCLFAWYVVPQLKTLKILVIHQGTGDPFDWAPLTPLKVLLAPVLTNSPMGMTSPGLGLQVGWPLLGFVLLAMGALIGLRSRLPIRRWPVVYLVGIFFLAFFIAWSPFDFWKFLPKLFWFIQFPYRAMMFLVLAGSLLAACALAAWRPRPISAGLIVAILFVLGWSLSTYVPRPDYAPDFVQQMIEKPDMGPAAALMYLPDPVALGIKAEPVRKETMWAERVAAIESQAPGTRPTLMAPDHFHIEHGGKFQCRIIAATPVLLELPVLYYPGMLDVRDNGSKAHYRNAGQLVAVPLGPGRHRIEVRFAGVGWTNVLGAFSWGALAIAGLATAGRLLIRSLPSLWPSRGTSPVSPHTILIAFVAMVLAATVPIVRPVSRLFNFSPRVKATASSSVDPDHGPELAFDDDRETVWVAADSDPTTVTAKLSKPGMLRKVVLEPRRTSLYEGWQHVEVTLFRENRKVYSAEFQLWQAAREEESGLTIPPTTTDRIELRFSDPVLEKFDGTRVTPNDVHPGYREIRFIWQ
jgi:hypothetical protein